MSSPLVESFGVVATLAAQRIVRVSAANTVAFPSAQPNGQLPVGITTDTVLDTISSIPVQLNGKAKLFFNDTVAAAGLVTNDASGRGVPFVLSDTTTSLTLTSSYIGPLVDAAVAATGTIAQVLIAPGLVRTSA